MKITDLNIDCLEGILDLLEFRDLIIAADSNKRICHAAKFVFARKYRQKKFKFNVAPSSVLSRCPPLHVGCQPTRYKRGKQYTNGPTFDFLLGYTLILELKIALPFLRCFGCVIDKIELRFINTVHDRYIVSYVNQFCVESITKIHICDITESSIDYFEQPFTRVKKLTLRHSYRRPHEDQLTERNHSHDWLNRLFPKLERLKMLCLPCSVLSVNEKAINHYPHLEMLDIQYHDSHQHRINHRRCKENVIKFFKMNPQLKQLRARFTSENYGLLNLLQNVEESLQNLESLVLTLWIHSHHLFDDPKFKTLHFKSVKNLDVEFEMNRPGDHTIDLPFSFEQLKMLSFQPRYTHFFYNCMKSNPNISTLGLDFENCKDGSRYFEKLKRLTNKCSSLTKININTNMSNFLAFCNHMLPEFKTVDCINIELLDKLPRHYVFQSIKDHLNGEWSISIQKDLELVDDDHIRPFATSKFYYIELKRQN